MTTDRITELQAAVNVDQERHQAAIQTRLDALRRRVDSSSGPHHAVDLRHQQGGQIRVWANRGGHIANVLRSGPNPPGDADLFAHAHEDIAWLLDLVNKLIAGDLNGRSLLGRHYLQGVLTDAVHETCADCLPPDAVCIRHAVDALTRALRDDN